MNQAVEGDEVGRHPVRVKSRGRVQRSLLPCGTMLRSTAVLCIEVRVTSQSEDDMARGVLLTVGRTEVSKCQVLMGCSLEVLK